MTLINISQNFSSNLSSSTEQTFGLLSAVYKLSKHKQTKMHNVCHHLRWTFCSWGSSL